MATKEEIANIIDNSLLKEEATRKEVINFCKKCIKYGIGGVCIYPHYTKLVSSLVKKKHIRVVTVVGYPSGMSGTETKVYEAIQAVKDGTDEIDMVMNIGEFKSGNYSYVKNEIKKVVKAAKGRKIKVIIEAALLTDSEIKRAARTVMDAGADFVKTSTGKCPAGGASVKAVRLIKSVVKDKLGIKAAGGIRDLKHVLTFIKAGASRIGTSTGFQILDEF